ncbi:MAG: acetate--CoA ligase family protein [Pseudomonadota bacterium]
MKKLRRLLRPRSIAVVGGGAWCEAVVGCCRRSGFDGPVWPVHPTRETVADLPAFKSIQDLTDAPDASFIGVNRNATIEVVEALVNRGAGGAVCFASGFKEAKDGCDLQESLLAAAGDMPLLGPNCYGFINNLEGAALWPDVHGLKPVKRGVAIIGQSSNVLLNLSMQRRGLPIAYLAAAGNQASVGMADIGQELLGDDRVTALGLHVEGFGDIRALEALTKRAQALGKAIVILKAGRSAAAQQATLSHTASVAGSDAGARALMARLGMIKVESLTEFLSTLGLVHLHGCQRFDRIASLSCSGGEASLMADAAEGLPLDFPSLTDKQKRVLQTYLGDGITLANPLDYHTNIWRNAEALKGVFASMVAPEVDMTCLVLDYPHPERCDHADWDIALDALIAAKVECGRPFALIATLPENMAEEVAERAMGAGIVPFLGLDDALSSLAASQQARMERDEPILLSRGDGMPATLTEAAAKKALAGFGLKVPASRRAATLEEAAVEASAIGFPVVLKGEGAAHKSEAGLVRLGLACHADVLEAGKSMHTDRFLIEAMVKDPVAELLIGVVRDPAHGFVLTLGAGGTLTELLEDSASLLIPASRHDIEKALSELRIGKLLRGYRGKPAADMHRVLDAILAIQAYVVANAASVVEVEVNPLLVTPTEAIAVDALIARME